MNSFSIYLQQNIGTKIKSTISFIISQNDEILRYKTNKTYIGFVCEKLYNTGKLNEEIDYVYGLEDSTWQRSQLCVY